jgi:WD40 repeat protein
MKQRKWLQLIISLVWSTLLLDACTFSVEVLSTPTSSTPPATHTSMPPTATQTVAAPTEILASVTPTLIPIRADTIYMLEIFKSFQFEDVVHTLAFTPDGTVLAAAGGNTEGFDIHIWDVATGRDIGIFNGHGDIVWSLAFSPDGQLLVSASRDRTAKVRDWHNGDILKILNFPGEVTSLSFAPDGQSLAVGGVDEMVNQIRNAAVWTFSVDSWEPLVKFPEYWNIAALAYSPDGSTLVGGGTSRNVQVWKTSDGTSLFTLSHAHQVSKVAISPDGSTVATATCEAVVNTECAEGGVWLWDLPTGRLLKKLTGFPDIVENVRFSTDGSTLIAASRGGTLRFYSTSDYQTLFEFAAPDRISALALSPDGGLLATGNFNGEVHLWKIVYRP